MGWLDPDGNHSEITLEVFTRKVWAGGARVFKILQGWGDALKIFQAGSRKVVAPNMKECTENDHEGAASSTITYNLIWN